MFHGSTYAERGTEEEQTMSKCTTTKGGFAGATEPEMRSASTTGSTWTYVMPIRHVWVEAETIKVALDPDSAIEILKEMHEVIARVRVVERYANATDVETTFAVEMLKTSCPFCAAGAGQLLQSNGWLYVHKLTVNDDLARRYPYNLPSNTIVTVKTTENGVIVVASVEGMHTPLKRLKPALKNMLWKAEHPGVDLDGRYVYSKEEQLLEENIGPFAFRLPRCPRDLLKAAEDLHNCMADFAVSSTAEMDWTIVLVCKGDRTVADIGIREGVKIVEARIACNADIRMNPDIDAAFEAWAKEKRLVMDLPHGPW